MFDNAEGIALLVASLFTGAMCMAVGAYATIVILEIAIGL